MADEQLIEAMARDIAKANGDNFADAFKNKTRWIAKRGVSAGRFRDVNEPFQSDYLDMARAAHTIAKAHWEARIRAERETCQRLAEEYPSRLDDMGAMEAAKGIALAIRNRNLEQGEGR